MPTALVTGAGQGIGRAIARRLAADGHHVIVVDMNEAAADEVAAEIDGQAFGCDVSDAEAVEAVAAEVPSLDVLVNNAGIFPRGGLRDVTPDVFHSVMAVNVLGPLLMVQAFLPLLQASHGSVVNIASIAALSPVPGVTMYSPSKAALVALTQQCAVEFAGTGIRFNAVAPGTIETEGAAFASADPEREQRTKELLPLGRRGTPGDIADVVAWFASDDSRYVTGQTLVVDGGMLTATVRFLQAAQG